MDLSGRFAGGTVVYVICQVSYFVEQETSTGRLQNDVRGRKSSRGLHNGKGRRTPERFCLYIFYPRSKRFYNVIQGYDRDSCHTSYREWRGVEVGTRRCEDIGGSLMFVMFKTESACGNTDNDATAKPKEDRPHIIRDRSDRTSNPHRLAAANNGLGDF